MSSFDFSEVYSGLKDFQRDTVEYVFQRMYLDAPPAHRFLVADEVGLGKTLVAKGLIARDERCVGPMAPRMGGQSLPKGRALACLEGAS